MTSHLRATRRHLSYGITQCYLPPDTSELARPNPSQTGWQDNSQTNSTQTSDNDIIGTYTVTVKQHL